MLPNGVRIGYLAWFSVLIKCFTPLKDEIFDKRFFQFCGNARSLTIDGNLFMYRFYD